MKNCLNNLFLLFFGLLFINLVVFLTGVIKHTPTDKTNQIAGVETSSSETTVSVSIGEYHFTLFGYTSPSAKVTFSGLGIFDETYADETGYFIFNNRFSPRSPREACLTAQDVFGRLSAPLCLPPFPTVYNVTIGPVIMPPTISVDKDEYWVGDEVVLTGQTIPNTRVNLSVFTDNRSLNQTLADAYPETGKIISLVPPAYGFSFPQLETKSDKKGNFSVSISTDKATDSRVFVRSNFNNSFSPKSLTLKIKILPWWMIILKIFALIFGLFRRYWLEITLLTEFAIVSILLTKHFFHPRSVLQEGQTYRKDRPCD